MKQDDSIFKFINPNDNTNLSSLKGYDLSDLINLINNFYLTYRSKLNINKKITFGLEIEVENTDWKKVDDIVNNNFDNSKGYLENWITKLDLSLHKGREINSPILRDTYKTWKELRHLCVLINKIASIDNSSSGHVHIGTQILGNNISSWLNFIKLWSTYENIIYRFSYGEYLNERPVIIKYAKPISMDLWQDSIILSTQKDLSLDELVSKVAYDKNQAINFDHIICKYADIICDLNTIEFRCPNGTLDHTIHQNNINTFIHLLLYSNNNNFDMDTIIKRHNSMYYSYDNLEMYEEISLEQALEFVDLIFDKNIDKVYFLRQYLKNMEICKNINKLHKAKKFTTSRLRKG